MPDLIWKLFGSGQLWPLRPAGNRNQSGLYTRDPIFHIRLGYFFGAQKAARMVTTGPQSDPLLYLWPGSGMDALSWISTRETDRDRIRPHCSVPDAPSESDPFLYVWPRPGRLWVYYIQIYFCTSGLLPLSIGY